jgi:hypothetical protein
MKPTSATRGGLACSARTTSTEHQREIIEDGLDRRRCVIACCVVVSNRYDANQPLLFADSEITSQVMASETTTAGITAPDGPMTCRPPAITIM